ncbi:hypothetical protein [Atlantibacter hermannii]|uniref:hypothetical protein n=1 Tax=Atlantibacter hermannii TaxID=565 RepID=UPI0028973156|nr:hypothetical protein [Atlantibacter hermannii]
MATNDFKPFATGAGANVMSQSDYLALAALITGFQSGKASSAQVNKALRQSSTMAALIGQFIANAGSDALDDGDLSGLVTKFTNALAANPESRKVYTGIVGDTRNARMSVTAASATATYTADSVIVEDSSGRQYRIKSLSANINLATTGAGGMDTGTVPVTGFVALYAIYNPTNGNKALLAVNATAAAVPEIYGGVNMPAGYTASALVSVWPVAASKFIIGLQQGRKFDVQYASVMTTTAPTSGYQPFPISSSVPANAKAWSGGINISGSQSIVGIVSADAGGMDAARMAATGAAGTAVSTSAPFRDVSIITPQTAYYFFTASGTSAINIYYSGYIF